MTDNEFMYQKFNTSIPTNKFGYGDLVEYRGHYCIVIGVPNKIDDFYTIETIRSYTSCIEESELTLVERRKKLKEIFTVKNEYYRKYPKLNYPVYGFCPKDKIYWVMFKNQIEYYQGYYDGEERPFRKEFVLEISSVEDYLKGIDSSIRLKELSKNFKFIPPKK